jgi:hypothetical protein
VAEASSLKRALLFILALLALVPVCLALWGLVLPAYARAVGSVTGFMLGTLGHPIQGVQITPQGILNTQTRLAFLLEGREPTLDIGALLFNVPPFIALMAATPGLALRCRIRRLTLGLAILAVGHVLYVALVFINAPRIAAAPQVPTALGEAFLTLPFLLWIVLGYWDRIAALFAPPEKTVPVPPASE